MAARRKTTDAQITEALRVTNGNVHRARLLLGAHIAERIRANPGLLPQGVTKKGRGREKYDADPRFTDAIRQAQGNVAQAADILGVSTDAIYRRIRRHPTLWPEGVSRGNKGVPPRNLKAADAAVTAALRASNGSQAGAAKALGISRAAVGARVANNPALWPEGVPRQRERKYHCDVATMRAALRVSNGNVCAAADALGFPPGWAYAYISARPDAWPEGVKRFTERGCGAALVERVRRALESAGGNQSEAARSLGVTRTSVSNLIARCPDAWPAGVPRLKPGHWSDSPFALARRRKAVA